MDKLYHLKIKPERIAFLNFYMKLKTRIEKISSSINCSMSKHSKSITGYDDMFER